MTKNTEQIEKTEVQILKEALEDQRAANSKQMAQMMILIQDITSRLPSGESSNNHPEMEAMMAKVAKLEESVQKQEKIATIGIDMEKLCLFPDAKLPDKFKPIDWDKFDGSGDPKAHLQTYVGTLSMYDVEKNSMAQMFQQTLTGSALRWFLNLDNSKKKTWEDIGAAFVA